MSEWISVDERLPITDRDGDFQSMQVIVTDGERVGVTDFNAGGMPKPWSAFDDYGDIGPDHITHWQPLPEPPK
jgi:hypothetical protein